MATNILSVSFDEESVQIVYCEDYDSGPRAAVIRHLHMDVEGVERQLDAVLDLLREVIDAGLLSIRNPEKKKGVFGQ